MTQFVVPGWGLTLLYKTCRSVARVPYIVKEPKALKASIGSATHILSLSSVRLTNEDGGQWTKRYDC